MSVRAALIVAAGARAHSGRRLVAGGTFPPPVPDQLFSKGHEAWKADELLLRTDTSDVLYKLECPQYWKSADAAGHYLLRRRLLTKFPEEPFSKLKEPVESD